jgi:hypothetical protein
MIRFVDLGRQLWVDENDPISSRQFCFFDTVTDRFLDFDGEQVFETWRDVEEARLPDSSFSGVDTTLLERCKGLCPPWVFTGDPPTLEETT